LNKTLPNSTKEQNTHPKMGKGGTTKIIQSLTKREHSKHKCATKVTKDYNGDPPKKG
jgi:hypothetical protein